MDNKRQERIKFGDEQEIKVAKYIRLLRPDYQVMLSKEQSDWSSFKDLKYGDVLLKKDNNILYFDVKRGSRKGLNGISFQSINAYSGDYFILTTYDFDANTSYVISTRLMKNYAQKEKDAGRVKELPSGSPGIYISPATNIIEGTKTLLFFIKNSLP